MTDSALMMPLGPRPRLPESACGRASRDMHGRSDVATNMLTRIPRSAATSGSSVPSATGGSMVPRQWQRPSQAPGRLMTHTLMHAQDLGTEDDLVLVHEPLGVGRSQKLSHLDGSGFAVLLALPAEPCA